MHPPPLSSPLLRAVMLGVGMVLVACAIEALTLTRLQSLYVGAAAAAQRSPVLFTLVRERGTLVQFGTRGYLAAEPGVDQQEVIARLQNRYPNEFDEKKMVWTLTDDEGAFFYRLAPNWLSVTLAFFLATITTYPYFRRRQSAAYAKDGRLADVLALLQVLGQSNDAARSESGLIVTLLGAPRSAATWVDVAVQHPEFFRVDKAKRYSVILLARFARVNEQDKRGPIDVEYLRALMSIASELHDRDFSQVNRWHVWVPVIASAIAALFAAFIAK